ncbi:MAG: hypothetical protein F2796_03795 [Actinobacteria bacterium]|nr:hypothetical protein [Actinomycetota bacterium]
MPSPDGLRDLAAFRPRGNVLSVLLCTDMRDPRNVNGAGPWRIELRNGLRAARPAPLASHRELAAFDRAARAVEAWAARLDSRQRGRGVARFLAPGSGLDRAYTLQLPLEETTVVWDDAPLVTPLLALAGRGRLAGIVMVDRERVRLLSWAAGQASEPPNAMIELGAGRWRDYAGYAKGNPQRAQQTGRSPRAFSDRNRLHRRVFVREAAAELAGRLRELGWERIILVGAPQLTNQFERDLPLAAARLVTGHLPWHLGELQAAEIGARVEPVLLDREPARVA